VESLFTSMLNARFDERTRMQDPPYVSAYAFVTSIVKPQEMFGFFASVRSDAAERGVETMLTDAERASRFGFTSGELDRAQKRRLAAVERQYKERDKTNSRVLAQSLLSHFLTNDPAPSAAYEYAAEKKFVPEIQLEELNAAAKAWNVDRNRTVLVSGPETEGVALPDEAALRAIIARVAGAKVEPYVDTVAGTQLLPQLPEPGRVVSEKRFKDLDLVLWTLSNGARVYVKSTDFKDDEVLLRAWSPGGNSLAPDERWISS